ncbi:predicted protein [Nematostella vectensis]|uniref:G-protein coupled receptors family 1 profile domain-containing protein n=1 Tax=Nematostella vectensis TaxID=45351 RepID=A7SJT0_NEMVE|nr:predicted protein [Nematostella vectensis]|eukprot:XP_001628118.1 predicted protein [Nematostella vectensis]
MDERTQDVIFWCISGMIGIVIVTANFVTLLVFLWDSQLRRRFMNIFLASLSIADLLMGVLIIPGYATFCKVENTSLHTCWFLTGTKDYVFSTTSLNMLAICYDRYYAVLKPLYYAATINRRRVTCILIFVWVIPAIMTSVRCAWRYWELNYSKQFLDTVYDNVLLCVVFIIPLVIIITTNALIIHAIKKQKKMISSLGNSPAKIHKQHSTKACDKNNVATKLTSIPKIPSARVGANGTRTCISVSAVDPFIYTYYRRDFSDAVKKLVRCAICQ